MLHNNRPIEAASIVPTDSDVWLFEGCLSRFPKSIASCIPAGLSSSPLTRGVFMQGIDGVL